MAVILPRADEGKGGQRGPQGVSQGPAAAILGRDSEGLCWGSGLGETRELGQAGGRGYGDELGIRDSDLRCRQDTRTS